MLTLKVGEMEKFLLDYGIKWVGYKATPDSDKMMKAIAENLAQPK